MVNAQDLCAVFNKVMKDGWGVVPGFDGQLLTQTMIDEKITDDVLKKLASKWVGKHVVDAGGLFAHAFRTLGIADHYTSDGKYLETLYKDFCEETGKLPKGGLLPGMVLFKKRNDIFAGAGLYIGNNQIIEAKSSKIGIIVSKLNNEWTYWGRLKNIEYPDLISKSVLRKKIAPVPRILHGPVVVDGSNEKVNVRAENNMYGEILDVLPLGAKATVIDDCGDFCKIKYEKTGYIKKECLKGV